MTVGSPEALEREYEISGYWWLWLVCGAAWLGVSFVILQFDGASVTTVGLIVGLMFIGSGAQQIALAAIGDSTGWLSAAFGVLFVVAGIACLFNPEDTFAGVADLLGFLFLLVGVWWTVRALLLRELDSLWWLGLVAAVLMFGAAFWVSGQLSLEKAYTLLVFAGAWALMHGVIDVVRALQVRSLHRARST